MSKNLSVAFALRNIIRETDDTMQKFADKIGTGRIAISQLCNGHRRMTVEMAGKIARHFKQRSIRSWLELQLEDDLARYKEAKEGMSYQVEVVWNREFNFVPYGPTYEDEDLAIKACKDAENSGDGARVKKARVVDNEGLVVYAYGQRVRKGKRK